MSDKSFLLIAMDGGAASGKSTTSRELAKRYHLMHVDTGSHYRALTWYLLRKGVDIFQEKRVPAHLAELELGVQVDGSLARMTIDNEIVPEADLRSQEVNANVSTVAAIGGVRQFLFDYQLSLRHEAKEFGFEGLVMEGRDIGTVIFPEADFRFFLEADTVTRMQRRAAEGLIDAIDKRDAIDSSRKASPMVCSEGAIKVDTSHMPLEEVLQLVCGLIDAQGWSQKTQGAF